MLLNKINKDNFFLIFIAGPTAVGKTDVAIELAQHFNIEIINADSRQLYKEISIGTAKPNSEQLSLVKHYFVSDKSVHDIFTTGDFERQSLEIIENQKTVGKKAIIVCGGTGMYINALLNGLDDLPNGNEEIRTQLHESFLKYGIDFLQNQLLELDSKAYENIEQLNPQRLMRAIEVCLISGKKYSDFLNANKIDRPFIPVKIALNIEREKLYSQINKRVDLMVTAGLELEAKKMFPFKNNYALKTVGYNEFFEYFEGKITKEKAIELIKQHTRNYAKRQITWFKKDSEFKWFNPSEVNEIINFIHSKLKS